MYRCNASAVNPSGRRHRFLLTPGANFISGNTIRIDGAASQGTPRLDAGQGENSQSYNGFPSGLRARRA